MKSRTILMNAVSSKSGGARTYIHNLITELAATNHDHQYIFYVPSSVMDSVNMQWSKNVSIVATEIGSSSCWKRFLWDQIALRAIVKKKRVDVLISSSDFGMTLPPCRQILLIRNSLFFSSLYAKTFSTR